MEISKFVPEHTCSYDLLLPSDFQPPEYFNSTNSITDQKISELVEKLTISLNLSLNASASSSMKDFIVDILIIGYNVAKKMYMHVYKIFQSRNFLLTQ